MWAFFYGLGHALALFALELGLGHRLGLSLESVRSVGAGAGFATLLMLLAGLSLGFWARNPEKALNRPPQSLIESLPWTQILSFSLGLSLLSLLARSLLGPIEAQGLETAIQLQSVGLPPLVFSSAGAAMAQHAKPRALASSLLGFGILGILLSLTRSLAQLASYEPIVVIAYTALGAGVSALLTGFALAWFTGRLALVETLAVALTAGYAFFFSFLLSAPEHTQVISLPEGQLVLLAALIPAGASWALMMVGASFGFLLRGGGRYDAGFWVETRLALTYLSAHRKRRAFGGVTLIAVLGVCLGVMALIIVLSIMAGFEGDLKTKILGTNAHIIITQPGGLTKDREVEDRARQVEGAQSASAYVLGDAMIATTAGLSGSQVKGVRADDPVATADLKAILRFGDLSHLSKPELIPGAQRPSRLSQTRTSTFAGHTARFFGRSEPSYRGKRLPGIIIGRELSRKLRAYVGDTVRLVSPVSDQIGPFGPMPKLRRFRVAAVFHSGMFEYDATYTYIDLKEAQRFFGLENAVTGVEVKVKDVDATGWISQALKASLSDGDYRIQDWREMNKELFSALLLERLAMFIVLGMIVMVASFLIIAVLVMIVLQRKKEIAILKSIGASDASIMKIFVVEGLILGVGGALLGGLGGVLSCLLIDRYGVGLNPRIFYIERLPVVMVWPEIFVIIGSAVVISYLATIYPAMTAARHPPVKGLRDD